MFEKLLKINSDLTPKFPFGFCYDDPGGGDPGGGAGGDPGGNAGAPDDIDSQILQALDPQSTGDGKQDGSKNSQNAEDQNSTITGGDGEGNSPKGKDAVTDWSEEEKKTIEANFKDLPFNEHTKKVFDSYRNATSQLEKLNQSNSNLTTQTAHVNSLLMSGDVEGLQKYAKESLGAELEIPKNDPETRINQYTEHWKTVSESLQPILDEVAALDPNDPNSLNIAYQKFFQGANGIKARLDGQIAGIKSESQMQSLVNKQLQAAGVRPRSGTYNDLSAKAKANLTQIATEDKEALKNYEALKDYFDPKGGELAGLGVSVARAYGSNEETAKFFNAIGKALRIQNDLPNIIARELEKAKANPKPGGESGGSPAGGKPSDFVGTMNKLLSEHMGE